MLDQIIKESRTPVVKPEVSETPASNGRLTTGQVLVALANMNGYIGLMVDFFKKLPDLPSQQVDDCLRNIIDAAKNTQAKAEKLMAANK